MPIGFSVVEDAKFALLFTENVTLKEKLKT